ncbi:MAG: NUDIX domain-containing protein [Bacilli bacterium]|nr:NUDIX domain-containing protein [Bacilli bacterium]
MDIKVQSDLGKFKLRVSAVIVQNDKILVHEGEKFIGFCFPGGHVEIGETTEEAILREVKEELDIETEVIELFCIHENIYKNKNSKINQEINYYYKLKVASDLPDNPFERKEIDKGVEKIHKFHWLPVHSIVEQNLQPLDVAKQIVRKNNIQGCTLLSDYRK